VVALQCHRPRPTAYLVRLPLMYGVPGDGQSASSNAKSAKSCQRVIASTATDNTGTYTFTTLSRERTRSVSRYEIRFDATTVTVNSASVLFRKGRLPCFYRNRENHLVDGTTPIKGATVRLYKTSYTIYTIDNSFYSTRDLSGLESIQL